jgi:hypothetical protein
VQGGRVFRCGTLAALDEAGRGWLSALGIATVCDLRADDERPQAVACLNAPNDPKEDSDG